MPILIPDSGAVSDVNVRVRLNHTFDGDLAIRLIGPDGTEAVLSNQRGGSGDNFGSGANSCAGPPTRSTIRRRPRSRPVSRRSPARSVPTRRSRCSTASPRQEVWKLRVSDLFSLDTGTIHCFQLKISRRVYACCGVSGTPAVVGFGSSVVAESCSPTNGAIDPDETVGVSFALANAGSADTANVVATLLATGGVQTPSGPQSYGAIPTDGSLVSRTFSFVPAGTCGGSITATLQLQDGSTSLGSVSYPLTLGTTAAGSAGPFANATGINIPARRPPAPPARPRPTPRRSAFQG